MTKRSPASLFKHIEIQLQETGDQTYAEKQMAYMKDHFSFYGLNAAKWLKIINTAIKENEVFQGQALREFVDLCFSAEYRELHYCGLQMSEKAIKKEDDTFIYYLESLITTNAWWDSVDWIAKLVMLHFKKFPHQILDITERWIEAENMWLNRVAITFQRYKNYPTDWDLLCQYILRHRDSHEFFIQKAQGWALREHSKLAPQQVISFVAAHPELSNLTKREALKWLKKNGQL